MSITERVAYGRFAPGQSGNPAGRRPGSRNKSTFAIDAALEARAEDVAKRLVDLAAEGNGAAMRLCFGRVMPRRKGRLVDFALPPVESHADAVRAAEAVMAAIGDGELTPQEAEELIRVIEAFERLRTTPAKPARAP
jgi:hypothetical protein